jgi:hypothetical protein
MELARRLSVFETLIFERSLSRVSAEGRPNVEWSTK